MKYKGHYLHSDLIYPDYIPKEAIEISWMGKYYEDAFFFRYHNNYDDNLKYLKRCKELVFFLKENQLVHEGFHYEKEVLLLEQTLNEGYLITYQIKELINTLEEMYLYDLIGCLDNDCCLYIEDEGKTYKTEIGEERIPFYNFAKLKNLLLNKDPSQLEFDDFQIENEDLYSLLRKNENWYDYNRDISIFLERNKGKYIQELADQFHMKRTAVSMVIKKVSGAMNYWKGKIFEDFIEMRLKSSRLFTKVVKDAGKGESDIKAYTKDKLYIYSLKNLKIDYSPYWLITKEELLPELRDSKLCSLDYETHLILLIYDNHHKRILQTEIDYNHVENIDLSK